MTNYTGPATVTTADGVTINVTVNLRSHTGTGRGDWRATLATADGIGLLNVDQGRLALPNGNGSDFISTNGLPDGRIEVVGSSGEVLP